jgi:predicted nucleic acid-binding protein
MALVVVDASALAALLFGESTAAQVAERLEKAVLAAPTLLRYEVSHACLKKIARYPDRRGDLLRATDDFTRMEIQEIEIPPLEATLLAEAAKLSFYDASYLWLSRALGAPLVTLDRKLQDAASRPC